MLSFKSGVAAALALALGAAVSAPTLAAEPTTFVQAGRLLADPATGKVETAKTLVIQGGRIVRIADGIIAGEGLPEDKRGT